MRDDRMRLLDRAVGRITRWSVRAREEVRGLSIRVENRRADGLPIPPSSLMQLVAGSADVEQFLASGERAAGSLREILSDNGIALGQLGTILDFGCGVGRVLRHWSTLPGPELHGVDHNPELIAWCERHLPFARFRLNRLRGGLDHAEGSFDLVYAISVFSHLDESLQFFWIRELTRVLRPGGHLYLTTQGAPFVGRLSEEDRRRFRRGELVVVGSKRAGSIDCAAFHPEPYVREILAEGLTVVDLIPEGAPGNPRQDVYLLRKP